MNAIQANADITAESLLVRDDFVLVIEGRALKLLHQKTLCRSGPVEPSAFSCLGNNCIYPALKAFHQSLALLRIFVEDH
jgi:hypothetical protein